MVPELLQKARAVLAMFEDLRMPTSERRRGEPSEHHAWPPVAPGRQFSALIDSNATGPSSIQRTPRRRYM